MKPFRLRCKVLLKDGHQYLVPLAIRVGADQMVTVGMSEEDTTQIALTVNEYNALPYHWFEDTGPAPHNETPWVTEKITR